MPTSQKWGRVAILVLLVATVGLWWSSRPAPAPPAPQAKKPPLPRAFALSNAPTATLKAVATPMSAVTNQAIKELISAAAQFRAAGAAPQTPAGKKFYTAEHPLPRQVATLQRLHAESGGTLQAYLRPESHVPVQLKGYPLAEPDPTLLGQPNGDELMAKRFLQANRDVLLLSQPDDELRLNHRETDKLGRTVLRYSQFYRGLEVWPGEIGVHSDAAGAIDLVHTTTVPTPEGLDVMPRVTAEQAMQRARARVPGGMSGTATEPKLLIYAPLDQPSKLAWKLELSFGLDQHWQVVVDAQTGSNLKAVNMCICANVAGSGVDLLGVTRSLNVDQQGSLYYMRNLSKPMFNAATGVGSIQIVDARNATESQIFVDNRLANRFHNISTNPNSWTNADAVSAAFNFSEVHDYYLQTHSRNSYDGQGSSIIATVRIGGPGNAFWHPGFKQMFFHNLEDRYAASLDVIGHEMTHGVADSIGAKGILEYSGQSGALNESFADIFGEMVEARSNAGSPDWLLGTVLNRIVRNMSNPPALNIVPSVPYPAKMSNFISTTNDNGGVHWNSSIINRAYFLIAAGLGGGIGISDAERTFYRTLTTKFLPQSQFIDARLGAIASAEELFGVGSRQALKVAEGFDAIELFGAPVNVPQSPTNLPAVSAPESTLWLYYDSSIFDYSLRRYEAAQGDSASGVRLATFTKVTRPSVTGGGAIVAFVTTDNSLALLNITNGPPTYTASGLVQSLAFSPNASFAAISLRSNGVPTSQLAILDFVRNITLTVDLKTPVFDDDPISNISYAGSMTFSPDEKTLVFGALSEGTEPDGSSFSAWGLYTLDMTTYEIHTLMPPLAGLDMGNPAFSRTSSRFVVFDAIYQGDSYIFASDLATGSNGIVGTAIGRVGRPSFTGDDSAILYADTDNSVSTGVSVYRQPLSTDKLAPSGSRARWVSNSPVAITYRRGAYTATNAPPSITFTAPADGSIFTSPANFNLSYNAADLDGSIAKVELYEGNVMLIARTNAPFTNFSASNFKAGFHRYHLRAYDDRGASTLSSPLRIAIRPSQTNGVFTASGTKRFELALGTTNTGSYRLEYSTNLVNWTSLGSTESLSNAVYFSDTGVTNHPRRFYRAVKLP
jgi:Zn-dependent metalloprotease